MEVDDENQKMYTMLDGFNPVVLQVISININLSFPYNIPVPVQGIAQHSKWSVQIFHSYSYDLPTNILNSQWDFAVYLHLPRT